MLTGDDLTIQLFILASAVAVLGIAVTQAGWTHKWFVRSLFVIAAGLATLAFYWKPIRDAHPEVGPVASDVAGNSISWFTLLVAGFGVVFFLDILARTGWLEPVSKPKRTTTASSLPGGEPPKERTEPAAPRERIFVSITPERLMDFYENRTTLQGDQLAENYLGKWTSMTGTIGNVGVSGLVFVSVRLLGYKHVMMCFDKSWKDRVSLLVSDQSISVVGEIGKISFDNVVLNNCEIVG